MTPTAYNFTPYNLAKEQSLNKMLTLTEMAVNDKLLAKHGEVNLRKVHITQFKISNNSCHANM